MTLEDAKYYSILTGVGEFGEFQKYMDVLLFGTGEIDDIDAELLYAGNDYNKCAEILSNYISSKNVDDAEVVYRLVNYLKLNNYYREQILFKFEKFVREANKAHEDILEEPWSTMKILSRINYYEIVYDSDYDNFINHGILLTEDAEMQDKLLKWFG